MTTRDEFNAIIDNKLTTENDLQSFLEKNSEFIPTDFLNGHQLNFQLIISKLRLGNEYITDFAYLTKNSGKWTLVLIEIEQASKKVFLKDNGSYPRFTAEFNGALAQVTAWKNYIANNKSTVEKKISRLKIPMENNVLDFKYILVIGRDEHFSEEQIGVLRETEKDDLKILTYDSLGRRFENNKPRMILSPIGDKDFKIKFVPENYLTNFFGWVTSEGIQISLDARSELIKQGYSIEEWESGKLLHGTECKITKEEAYEKSPKTDFDKVIYDIK